MTLGLDQEWEGDRCEDRSWLVAVSVCSMDHGADVVRVCQARMFEGSHAGTKGYQSQLLLLLKWGTVLYSKSHVFYRTENHLPEGHGFMSQCTAASLLWHPTTLELTVGVAPGCEHVFFAGTVVCGYPMGLPWLQRMPSCGSSW